MKKLLALTVMMAGLAASASAIPAFARKYGYSCEVCHAPIPRLKAFGEEFQANGYRIPDKEPPRATIDTGDATLLLQRELPLAMRFDGFLTCEPQSGQGFRDIRTPFVMKIMSGGNISDKISYYTYFLMTEESKIVGLEDTYLYFHDLFGLPLSLVFGQYRVSDPIKPSEIRMTFEEYRIFTFTVGDSKIALSYDRGLMIGYTTKFGTDLSLQVVNGNGIDEPDIFDSDKYKNVVGRVAQSFWKGNLRIGILGYTGKEAMLGGLTNSVAYFGPDIRLRLPMLELTFEYVRRTDSNPFNRIELDSSFAPESQKHTTDAFLAEAILAPQGDKSRAFLTLAYNRIDSCLEETKYETLTVNVCYLLRRNLKWIAECRRDLAGDNHRFVTGIITAF